jgi:tRNA nucleotidyltransferase (CCA-adding enzyme)
LGKEWSGTEWAGEEDEVLHFKLDNHEVDVIVSHPARVRRKEAPRITIIWNGALEFEGNFNEFRREYPYLAKEVKGYSEYL